MKKILFIIATFITHVTFAQTLVTPQPSSTQTIKQNFGLSFIELSYSRPNVKGRNVFGDLVPYGKIWRTGANQATTLTFGDEVTIGEKKIAAGKYGLVSIPGKDNWALIITKQLDITSPAAYKEENDVVRVNLKPVRLADKVETFTMQFANIKASTCDLVLLWDNISITLPVSTDVDTKVMAQINNIMTKDNLPYFNAALYYMDNGKDLNQALAWFNKATEQNPDAYFIHYQKAVCLSKLGKKQEAVTTAMRSMELAKVAKNMDYVKLNEDLIAKLR